MTQIELEQKASTFSNECFGELTVARVDAGKKPLPPEFANDVYVIGVKCYMAGYEAALEEMEEEKDDNVTIPRKLANTLLGILESEYEGTEMFQDEINELKGLL